MKCMASRTSDRIGSASFSADRVRRKCPPAWSARLQKAGEIGLDDLKFLALQGATPEWHCLLLHRPWRQFQSPGGEDGCNRRFPFAPGESISRPPLPWGTLQPERRQPRTHLGCRGTTGPEFSTTGELR